MGEEVGATEDAGGGVGTEDGSNGPDDPAPGEGSTAGDGSGAVGGSGGVPHAATRVATATVISPGTILDLHMVPACRVHGHPAVRGYREDP